MDYPGELLMVASIGLLALAALTDLATRTIPDTVSVALCCTGLLGRAFDGLAAIGISVVVALALFLLLVVLHARGALGGGDVKLAAAAVLGLSPDSAYQFVVVTALAGGVMAILHLLLRPVMRIWRATPPPRGASLLRRIAAAERWRIARHGSLPYGVAIACGGIWATLASRGG